MRTCNEFCDRLQTYIDLAVARRKLCSRDNFLLLAADSVKFPYRKSTLSSWLSSTSNTSTFSWAFSWGQRSSTCKLNDAYHRVNHRPRPNSVYGHFNYILYGRICSSFIQSLLIFLIQEVFCILYTSIMKFT